MRETRREAVRILAVAAVFIIAFAVRWAMVESLSGDDHYTLWNAATFLKGDRPFVDFVDLGDPLYWGMSTLVQAISGYRVVGEVLLGTTLAALAIALAFHLAWRASGSAAVAAGLTLLALFVVRRELYSYPKILLYPLGIWLCWRYIDRPSVLRAVALAFGVAVAFGYRHDHGAYLGVGAAAACVAAHWPEGPRRILFGWLRFGIALLVVLSPFMVLVQVHEGIVDYIRERVRLAGVIDATSRRPVWFSVDRTAPAHWFGINPPRPARVFVEWKADVTPETRVVLEREYSLTRGVDPKRAMYEYLLSDVSRDNLASLVRDARIVDRSGISVSYRDRGDGSKAVEGAVATERPPADAPPAARALVEIRWDSRLDERERATLERRYGLLDYRSKWEYALIDVSSDNIRAIVEDRHVHDTGLIDRDAYRPMEESWLVRAQRSVPLLRVSIAPRFWQPYNAGIFLHYVSVALPYVMLVMLVADRIRGRRRGRMVHAPEKMFAAAVMMAVAYMALLRRTGYFADHAVTTAVLAACVSGHVFDPVRLKQPASLRLLSGLVVGIVLMVSTFAAITYGNVLTALAGMDDGVRGVWNRSVRSFESFNTSPPIDAYAPRGTKGDRGLIRYIYECTRPDDRVWILSDLFAFPYYSERRVVGHIYWQAGLRTDRDFQRQTIEKVDKEEVPIILGLGGQRPLQYLEAYPLVHAYVERRFTSHYAIPEDSVERGQVFWLLTDSRRKPTGTYGLLGLPCFQ